MGLGQKPSSSFPLRSPPLFSFFSSALLLLLLSSTVSALASSAWSVLPSNRSADLSWTNGTLLYLKSASLHLPTNLTLAPLTQSVVQNVLSQPKTFHATGQLLHVDAANSLAVQSGDIAFISCDPSAYPGNLDASETVANVITSQQQPAAVLLYSTQANHCNYSANEVSAHNYANVFTVLTPNASHSLQAVLDSASASSGSTSIVADMSFPIQNVPMDNGDSGNAGNNPNTAMIILYSITGIITALFLAIIIMGAVRAHRHPERYGPRYTAGRPRQSRARGIARAMLETIPIVKFGDDYNPKTDAVKGDVELGPDIDEHTDDREHEMTAAGNTPAQSTAPADQQGTPPSDETHPNTTPNTTSTDAPADKRTGGADTNPENPNFSCPICTDDFVKGQDLRVLPCNHKFHPECIDPWLVNVSGTCPLCRIDLNPPQAEGETEQDETDTANAPTESHREGTPDHTTGHRRRLSNYLHGPLNARRMRDASVEERLAALRSVREETTTNPPAATEEADRRRSRLTQRLRDRFRIRTQPHREEAS
ncbi:hypothetical protein BJX96DRAFT_179617 [Aspergillus floccosus]